jgi:hypothetical protein
MRAHGPIPRPNPAAIFEHAKSLPLQPVVAASGTLSFMPASHPSSKPFLVETVLPLHLFAIFCMFYIFYFVAKSLVMVNKGRQVAFGDYAKSLILLFLFPIGVWRIQPRINQLYAQSRNV